MINVIQSMMCSPEKWTSSSSSGLSSRARSIFLRHSVTTARRETEQKRGQMAFSENQTSLEDTCYARFGRNVYHSVLIVNC